ncbi:MAG: hypothetical protein KGP14_07615 [Betaproteobacteria bacterium]|nr:hypothetical protein [Betaproteobacteria bacterium]
MSRDPIRLEPLLTRDYIDRAAKMRELQTVRVSVSTWDLIATWIVLLGVVAWIVMVW